MTTERKVMPGEFDIPGHTPGPWTVESSPTRSKWIVRSASGIELAGLNEANARLIAAAPEMLARLKDHVENGPGIEGAECPSCGRDNSDSGNVCTANDCMGVMDRAAIAKAEGREL